MKSYFALVFMFVFAVLPDQWLTYNKNNIGRKYFP